MYVVIPHLACVVQLNLRRGQLLKVSCRGESSRLCESCQSAPSQQACQQAFRAAGCSFFLSLTIYIFLNHLFFFSHFVIFKNIWVFGWVVDNTFLWCDKHIFLLLYTDCKAVLTVWPAQTSTCLSHVSVPNAFVKQSWIKGNKPTD